MIPNRKDQFTLLYHKQNKFSKECLVYLKNYTNNVLPIDIEKENLGYTQMGDILEKIDFNCEKLFKSGTDNGEPIDSVEDCIKTFNNQPEKVKVPIILAKGDIIIPDSAGELNDWLESKI